jgi:uncharacterized protein
MLSAATRFARVAGRAGVIDTAIDYPASAVSGVAVVAHPHPLYGGTRDNKVVQTLARALVGLGYVCWRPNFRGVGESEGSFDNGNGESDDILSLIEHAYAQVLPDGTVPLRRLVLAGFSFGSFVQSQVAQRLAVLQQPASRLVLVGTATSSFAVAAVPADTVLIHGELDDVAPLASVLQWARQGEAVVTVIPGADHFFHHKLATIKQIVTQALR